MFESGQRVVCINEDWDRIPGVATFPRKNHVYVVHDIMEPVCDGRAEPYIRLVEIVNPQVAPGGEPRFHAAMFRPYIPRATDITVFHDLLNLTTVRSR